jgi:hypothetical protein
MTDDRLVLHPFACSCVVINVARVRREGSQLIKRTLDRLRFNGTNNSVKCTSASQKELMSHLREYR